MKKARTYLANVPWISRYVIVISEFLDLFRFGKINKFILKNRLVTWTLDWRQLTSQKRISWWCHRVDHQIHYLKHHQPHRNVQRGGTKLNYVIFCQHVDLNVSYSKHNHRNINQIPIWAKYVSKICITPAKCRQNNFDCEFQITPPAPVVDYIPDPAAVAAAYTNLNPMYATSPYPSSADNLYMTPTVHSSNFYPVTENLYHQYRLQGVSGYYPSDYHHSSVPTSYVANGFLPYDGYISTKEEKWQDSGKYYPGHDVTSRSMYSEYSSPTGHSQVWISKLCQFFALVKNNINISSPF